MSNMSYCRFENTMRDLADCEAHIGDGNLSDDEKRARRQLIKLCFSIVGEVDITMEHTDDEIKGMISEFENECDEQAEEDEED